RGYTSRPRGRWVGSLADRVLDDLGPILAQPVEGAARGREPHLAHELLEAAGRRLTPLPDSLGEILRAARDLPIEQTGGVMAGRASREIELEPEVLPHLAHAVDGLVEPLHEGALAGRRRLEDSALADVAALLAGAGDQLEPLQSVDLRVEDVQRHAAD